MSDEKKTTDDDFGLFRDSMDEVTPLKQDKVAPEPPCPATLRKKRASKSAQTTPKILDPGFNMVALETNEELHYSRPGVQHTVMRKLRRGQYRTHAELDLHGQTVAEAYNAVAQFLVAAQTQHARCVRIIHGKGLSSPDKTPVLKSQVNRWLQLSDAVSAFCSARPADGGTGAVYVLIKRKD